MDKNNKMLSALNSLLAYKLTAVNKHREDAEMCVNWGYGNLQIAIKKQATDEMRHAMWLIGRIIFFDGTPTASLLNVLKKSNAVSEMNNYNNGNESGEEHVYNEAIRIALECGDQGTVDLLAKIMKMQERYVDFAEIHGLQIVQKNHENYLFNQTLRQAS